MAAGAATVVRRAKPNPLNFLSQNSMVSIPEGADALHPEATQAAAPLPHDPMKFMSGMSEMPATPAYTWGVLQTPTETPYGFSQFRPVTTLQYPPTMATPTGYADPQRKTLSLQDMIQSPKVEDKAALLHSTYQQLYQVPPYGPPLPQAAPPYAVPAGPPVHYAEPPLNTLPPLQQAPLAMPPPAALHTLPPQGPMHEPPIYAVPTVPGAPGTPPLYPQPMMGQGPGTPPPLYPAQPMPGPIPAQPGTPPTVFAPAPLQAPHAMPQPMPTGPMPGGAPAPGGCPSIALGLVHGAQGQPPVSQPLQAHYGPPPSGAPTVAPGAAPGVVLAHPSVAAQPPPPPPNFAAPAVVVSPKAASAPAATSNMSESDIRTLLDVAMQSGNQEAVSAVARQAKAAGMSAERFRSLLPAPNSAAR
ncbi:unnamed protein product [Symbiodinium natans]|uniref:Uncharacterized protein n=1 Tax=Symbiodinium natans TaxID=878477 RepID=A0A812HT14_9DINO|nr:unnamed protein product [Symbiodinium natans]